MSSSSAPPRWDGNKLRRIVLRVLLGLVLVMLLLFGLVYCTSHAGKDGDSATSALPTFTSSATASAAPTTTAATAPSQTGTPGASSTATAATRGKTLTGSKSGTGAKSAGRSSAADSSKSDSAKARSGTTPRSAPNTGGGSDSGAVDLRLLTGGVLLLLASAGLGSVTFRRWRRAW